MRAIPIAAAIALLLLTALPVRAAPDTRKPFIVSGVITSATVDVTKPAAAPSIDLVIGGKAASITLALQGPSGQQSTESFGFPEFPRHTSLRGYTSTGGFADVRNTFTLYTQPGAWNLASLNICSLSGSCNSYDTTQLAALFPSLTFQVQNPNPPDITPPHVRHGKIETQTVSLSSGKPLRIHFSATDDVSGVATVFVNALLAGGGSNIFVGIQQFPRPVLRVEATAIDFLQQQPPPTGVYTISSISINDVAGNATSISDTATINAIFDNQTSFTVTP